MSPPLPIPWYRAVVDTIRALVHVDPARAEVEIEALAARLGPTDGVEGAAGLALVRGLLAFARGAFEPARRHAREAERGYREVGHARGLALARNLDGTALLETGQLAEAAERFLAASELWAVLDDAPGLARAENNLGLVHWRLGDLERARAHYGRALDSFRAAGDERGVGTVLYNLGLAWEGDEPETALGCYREALPPLERARDGGGIANALANTADALSVLGRLDEAGEAARRSLALREELGLARGVAGSRLTLARIALAGGDVDAAARELDLAAPALEQLGLRKQAADALRLRAQVHAARGEFEAAWRCEHEAAGRREGLLGEEAARMTAQAEARFELQHARREADRRTREAAELRAARAAAEAASRAKSDFLATVSHEIRTPLTSVIGATELLHQTELAPEQARLLRTLDASARSLLALVEDILDFSKIESGRFEIVAEPFRLDELLERVLGVVRPRAQTRGLLLSLVRTGPLPEVVAGDHERLAQVLLNLLSNAVKFTEVGGVELRVGASGAGALRFEVVDTGIGMDAGVLARVGEPFVQADGSTRRRYGGTGLGLAICRRIVERMRGQLEIRSEAGRGTHVALSLPLPEAALPSRPDGVLRGAPTRRVRVLLVDDDPDLREVMRLMLETCGAEVVEAGSGEEALLLARARACELVLLDVHMPDTDGYAVAEGLRAAFGRSLRVVGLTGAATAEARSRGLAAGMDDYVAKPVSLERLRGLLGQVGAEEPPGAAASRAAPLTP